MQNPHCLLGLVYIFFMRVFPRLFDNTVYLTSAERALCCTLQKWVPLSTTSSIHFSPTADHCCGYGVYHLHSPAVEYVLSTSLLQKNVQLQQMTVNKVNWWWIHLASLDTWAQVDRGEFSQRTALLLAFFLSMINFQYYSTLCNAIESMAWSHISEPLEYSWHLFSFKRIKYIHIKTKKYIMKLGGGNSLRIREWIMTPVVF